MEVGELRMHVKLSEPLQLSEDFDESMRIAYEYFEANIYNRTKRPALFDKEVYVEAKEVIGDRPVGFWHTVSIENTHQFKNLPCNNDNTMEFCKENCIIQSRQIIIKHQTETRNLCLYRASRLPWILDIINLANRGDPAVQTWLKPGIGKLSGKLYLRYNHYGNDYVLIFSNEKHFYRIISAFPVFYLKEKREFDIDAQKYAWSYF